MRRSWSVVFLALALSVASVARADEGADRNKAAADLAAAVLTADQYAEMMEGIVNATVQGLEGEMQRQGKTLPAGVPQRFRAAMEKLLPYQEMLDLQAGLLAKYYTTAEIGELAAFYRSPVGQKSLKIMPSVTADLMAMVQSKMMRELPAAMENVFKGDDEQPAAKLEQPTKANTKPAAVKKAR